MRSQVAAAGPFSTTDNLFFEPLVELLAHASRKQPQLLILITCVANPVRLSANEDFA